MKNLSQNKRRFLAIAHGVNQQLNPEFRLPRDKAEELYDREISPYGYPTHQSILIREGLAMFQYNVARMERKKESMAKGEEVGGEGFGIGTLCPNYYITKDLANSLMETKPPEGKPDFIHHEVMPTIKVVFPKDHSDIVTTSIRQVDNGIWVRLWLLSEDGSKLSYNSNTKEFQYKKSSKTTLLKKTYTELDYFIPFDGTGHCMLCDTREYFKKNLLEKNWIKMKYATQPYGTDHLPRCINDSQVEIRAASPITFKDEEIERIFKIFLEGIHRSYNFVINLLCLLTHEPDIISVQQTTAKQVVAKSKGFGSVKVNNVPNVHWLGADFTTRVIDSTPKDGEPQVGKPKKSHWRRGHWHTILQGPGRKQRTMKWFKPTFIRGHKQTEEVSK